MRPLGRLGTSVAVTTTSRRTSSFLASRRWSGGLRRRRGSRRSLFPTTGTPEGSSRSASFSRDSVPLVFPIGGSGMASICSRIVRGANLRNEVAHGLVPAVSASDAALLIHYACHLSRLRVPPKADADDPPAGVGFRNRGTSPSPRRADSGDRSGLTRPIVTPLRFSAEGLPSWVQAQMSQSSQGFYFQSLSAFCSRKTQGIISEQNILLGGQFPAKEKLKQLRRGVPVSFVSRPPQIRRQLKSQLFALDLSIWWRDRRRARHARDAGKAGALGSAAADLARSGRSSGRPVGRAFCDWAP